MRKIIVFILALLLPLSAYLFFAPIDAEPVAWQAPPMPSFETGPYARNTLLAGIERIAQNIGKGPEAVAFDGEGRIYTGFDDGRIARFEADGTGYTLLANTGGRPLGMSMHPDGSVIVCDAMKGLLRVGQDGKITVLATSAEGVPFGNTDDLSVTKDGSKVYFTDATSKFGERPLQRRYH